MKQYLEIGKAVTVHGVAGELKVYPWCDSAETLCALKTLYCGENGERPLTVERARAHKRMCLIKLEGVDTIEAARGFIERVFWAKREDIPLNDGDIFVADLVGARVITEAGGLAGEVRDVINTGAQDILIISAPGGAERMVPFVSAFIKSADAEKGEVVITPIKGLLDDAD